MSTTPAAYDGFDRMPIGDSWRPGTAGRELTDTDPWSGEILTRIPLASAADVEQAYAAAEAAQPGWAAALPEQRAAVMRKAADILDARHAEIASWIVRESGGTIAKAEVELGVVRAMPESPRRARWAELVRHARCAGETKADPDLWYPVAVIPVAARREAADAIAICHGCAVRTQCLELSLRHWNVGQHGIWGGLLPVERAEIRRRLLLEQDGEVSSLEESA